MKYRVPYRADGWTRITSHRAFARQWQVVEQTLEDGRILYVELMRIPWLAIEVVYAHVETLQGESPRATYSLLTSEQLELVEVMDAQDR